MRSSAEIADEWKARLRQGRAMSGHTWESLAHHLQLSRGTLHRWADPEGSLPTRSASIAAVRAMADLFDDPEMVNLWEEWRQASESEDRNLARLRSPNHQVDGDATSGEIADQASLDTSDVERPLSGAEAEADFSLEDDGAVEGDDGSFDLDPRPDHAAIRAYLQRAETRLSTVHRVAGAFISGAGILVLLPVLVRESANSSIPALLKSPVEWSEVLLLASLAILLGLPLYALWLLIKDLVLFFFTGHHFGSGKDIYYPRFILSGIQLSPDELTREELDEIEDVRANRNLLSVLVPNNQHARRRIDQRATAYHQPVPPAGDDKADFRRRDLLFSFTATKPRPLMEEAVKLEYSLTRHVLRARLLVLRYSKALLTALTTTIAAYAVLSIVDGRGAPSTLRPSEHIWMSGVILTWAGMTAIAVVMPARWVYQHTAAVGQDNPTYLQSDWELLKYERVAVASCTAAWCLALAARVAIDRSGAVSPPSQGAGVAWLITLLASGAVLAVAVVMCGLLRARPPEIRASDTSATERIAN